MKTVFFIPKKVIINTSANDEKLIPLTDEQLAYYEANPTASYDEVWNIGKPEAVPSIPIETPIEDYKKYKIQEMSQMSLFLMSENGMKDHQVHNELAISAEAGEVSERLKSYNKTVALLKGEYYRLRQEINAATSNADIDTVCEGAKFAEIIAKNMKDE